MRPDDRGVTDANHVINAGTDNRNTSIADLFAEAEAAAERYGQECAAREPQVYRAKATAEVCGACGRRLGPDTPVYLMRLRLGYGTTQAPVCADCATDRSYLWERRGIERACSHCGRPVYVQGTAFNRWREHVFCCDRCRAAFRAQRRKAAVRQKVCDVCGQPFTARRADAKTCSAACKQRAYRQRKGGRP